MTGSEVTQVTLFQKSFQSISYVLFEKEPGFKQIFEIKEQSLEVLFWQFINKMKTLSTTIKLLFRKDSKKCMLPSNRKHAFFVSALFKMALILSFFQ